jgi:hypothetical protein
MKIKYRIAKFLNTDRIKVLPIQYGNYKEAEDSIKKRPPGMYWIFQVYVVPEVNKLPKDIDSELEDLFAELYFHMDQGEEDPDYYADIIAATKEKVRKLFE